MRRRREPVGRWLVWALAGAIPFVVAWLFALLLEFTGLVPVAPPAPLRPGRYRSTARGWPRWSRWLLVVVVGWLALRPAALRVDRSGDALAAPGAAAAVLLALALLSVAVWVANPFAAALLLPGLHLALLLLAPEVHLRRWLQAVVVAVALAPLALVIAYYADQFGLSAADVPWTALLLVVGGGVGVPTVLAWCLGLGLLGDVLAILRARAAPRRRGPEHPRPRGYAGPGSLGGTRSAIRR